MIDHSARGEKQEKREFIRDGATITTGNKNGFWFSSCPSCLSCLSWSKRLLSFTVPAVLSVVNLFPG